MEKTKKYLLIILALSLLISLSYSLYFQNKPVVDAKKYDEVGWNLAQGLGYQIDPSQEVTRDYAILMVGPGYQFFLAGVYFIFGHSLMIVWILQSFMLALSGYIIFLITKEVFKEKWNPWIGLIAAALVALSPDLIMASGMIFTDILGIFLLVLSLWTFFKFYNSKNGAYLLISAVSLALGIMTRSTLAVLLPIFLLYLIKDKKWREMIVILMIVILIFLPWTVRNWRTYNMFMPLTAVGYMDFWWGNRIGATGELDDAPEITKAVVENDIKTVSELSIQKGKEFIVSHPTKFVELLFKKASIYFSFIRPTGWWPFPGPRGYALDLTRGISLALSGIYSVVIFTLGISGLWKMLKERKSISKDRVLFLATITILMPLSIIWLFVESRYRFPIYPLLAISAGYFVYILRQEKQWWKNKILWTIFTILALNSIFDIATNLQRILERIS